MYEKIYSRSTCGCFGGYTPEDQMEPTNHPFRKENDLPNLHDYGPC